MTNGNSTNVDCLWIRSISTDYRWATGNCMYIATNYHVGGRNKKQFIIIVQDCYGVFNEFWSIAKRTELYKSET